MADPKKAVPVAAHPLGEVNAAQIEAMTENTAAQNEVSAHLGRIMACHALVVGPKVGQEQRRYATNVLAVYSGWWASSLE